MLQNCKKITILKGCQLYNFCNNKSIKMFFDVCKKKKKKKSITFVIFDVDP